MKKGRISKDEEKWIQENRDLGLEAIATELDRDPESILGVIKKKVANNSMRLTALFGWKNPKI